jgi:NAD(P)-dependent dehydrogenase (short-subunit alcohol dehydrogenase family)
VTLPGVDVMPDPTDDEGLAGRVAVVTGGGASAEGIGNGRAAAILLARSGARVLVVDRDGAAAAATVAMIEAEGGVAAPFAADVTDLAQCEAMVADALSRWGRLDVVDNNVGIGSRGSVVTDDPARFARVMDVNVLSMVNASRAAIPAMIDTAHGGSIVNVSSISALRPRGLTAYSTSKGAVIALTKAMAVDHGPDGIRVNCVAPGPAYTPMVAGRGMADATRRTRRAATVLGTEGTGWDVGQAVRFLASARARWITGQVLVVDGGVTLRGPERDTDG